MAKKKTTKTTMQFNRAAIQPASIDTETREVDVVFATEAEVERFGWEEDYAEVLVCEGSAVRMGRAKVGLPVLDSHNAYSVENQLGVSVAVWINEKRELCARLRFSSTKKAADLFQDIQDGIIKSISVGYRVYKFEKEERPGQLPIYRATDWEPHEISFVPIPADFNSGVRSATTEHNVEIITLRTSNNLKTMKKRTTEAAKTVQYTVEGESVKKGDIVTADGVKGIALEDGDEGDTIELALIEEEGGAGNEEAAEALEGAEAALEDAAEVIEQATEAVAAAKEGTEAGGEDGRARLKTIKDRVRAAGLSDGYALALAESDLTLDQCSDAIIRRMSKKRTKVNGSHGITVGRDAYSKKRDGAIDAIMHRIQPRTFKVTEAGRAFGYMSLVEIGKELLAERGISTSGMSKMQVASYFFGRSHSSGDLPLLFEDVLNKTLRADYPFAPEYWDMIARQDNVSDFKAKHFYQFDTKNGMKEVAEGGEIKYTTLVEGKQSIRIKSYAEGIAYTRQAFINDDLSVFEKIPAKFVLDWAELRGELVWGLLRDNVKLADGKELFHADHKNLLTGASSVLSEESLAAAKIALSKQTSIAGRITRIPAKYLIVPSELEVAARRLMTQITPAKSEDVNVLAGDFDIIVEPRLTDAKAWYLSADPHAIDTLAYAYLEGNEALRVNSEDDFNTDTQKYAVRGDFGAAAVDYRGLVKGAGK